jgi:16S rRNA (uracil1498-N3)-methyltransferase
MHRFFCNPQNIFSNEIKIQDDNELRHIRNALRLKEKDEVVVLDGCGNKFICRINQLERHCAKLEIIEKKTHKKEMLDVELTIACAVPKKSKVDFIVEKLTEIGVDRIILLKTERTEVDLKDSLKKLVKLQRIAEASLKQSGNLFLPQIEYLNFKQLLELKHKEKFDLAMIPNLGNKEEGLGKILSNVTGRNILVAIGPEGDFSQKEINSAKEAGFVSASLGNTVLKVDTAAIVAAGFIKLYFEK